MGLEAGGNPLGRSLGGPWGVPGWILGFPFPGDHWGSNPKTDQITKEIGGWSLESMTNNEKKHSNINFSVVIC